jgi:hypothetical protein
VREVIARNVAQHDDIEFAELTRRARQSGDRLVAFLREFAVCGQQHDRAFDRFLTHEQVLDVAVLPTRIAVHIQHAQWAINQLDWKAHHQPVGNERGLIGFDLDSPCRFARHVGLGGEGDLIALVACGNALGGKFLAGHLINQPHRRAEFARRIAQPIKLNDDRNLVADECAARRINAANGEVRQRLA